MGALKFVHDIEKALAGEGHPAPESRIFSYPLDWMDDLRDRLEPEFSAGARKFIDRTSFLFARRPPSWKRALDITAAVFCLVLGAPLMAIVAVYIKLVSKGPVFFLQERVGHGGELFRLIKFRTMHANNDSEPHRAYLRELIRSGKPMRKLDGSDDSRIIPLGKCIRNLSIDELPQLFNVLRGEMSLVGPRPCIPYEAVEYLRWHKYRFDIRPGMTGLWQVSGKNKLSFREMIQLDMQYADRMCLLIDLLILMKTLPAVLQIAGEGMGARLRERGLSTQHA
jgi:lipopolysaccharide/colanic/teichoic acid biosynthesis glycosyltransferase